MYLIHTLNFIMVTTGTPYGDNEWTIHIYNY